MNYLLGALLAVALGAAGQLAFYLIVIRPQWRREDEETRREDEERQRDWAAETREWERLAERADAARARIEQV